MSESIELSHANTYIEMPKAYFNGNMLRMVPSIHRDRSIGEKIAGLYENNKQYAQEHALKEWPRLHNATELARKKIRDLSKETDLPSPTSMDVFYLDSSSFIQLFGVSFDGNAAHGKYSPEANFSGVRYDENFPDYFVGSLAFHELVHQEFDRHVFTYHTESIQNNQEETEMLTYVTNRQGLEVKRYDPKNPSANVNRQGDLLNELGNHGMQADYIREALENQDIFGPEIEERNNFILRMGGDPNDPSGLTLNFPFNNKSYKIRFDTDKIHFNHKGECNLVYGMGGFLIMQLADDLKKICGDVEGKPFFETFLRAKSDPIEQNKLRTVMDSKLDTDFYSRLKNTSQEDIQSILELVSEVQSKS